MRVRSGDIEIYYEVRGSGPDLVLLHPFPAHHGIWVPVAEQLSTRYRVITPDLRGHGDSGVGDGPAYMSAHAMDLDRVCQDAAVERAIFAGNSIGGYILFEFWRRFRERVSGLILCDTKAGADTPEARANRLKSAEDAEKHGTTRFIDAQIPKLIGETTRSNRPDRTKDARTMMETMSVAGLAAVQRGMAERPDSMPTLATINAPTLIIVGEEDEVTPVAEAEAMQRGIRGSALRRITAAGHYSPWEQPEEVHRVIRQFLESTR